jgi:hypothetical protein
MSYRFQSLKNVLLTPLPQKVNLLMTTLFYHACSNNPSLPSAATHFSGSPLTNDVNSNFTGPSSYHRNKKLSLSLLGMYSPVPML